MQKFHPRFARVLVPLVLTFFMTLLISGVSAFIALGLNTGALWVWPGAWMASWVVAFPAALVVLPFAQWLVRFVVRKS